MVKLGGYYLEGIGVTQDYGQAFRLFTLAADMVNYTVP